MVRLIIPIDRNRKDPSYGISFHPSPYARRRRSREYLRSPGLSAHVPPRGRVEPAPSRRTHALARRERAFSVARTPRRGAQPRNRGNGSDGGLGRGRLCRARANADRPSGLRDRRGRAHAAAFRLRRGGLCQWPFLRLREKGGRGRPAGLQGYFTGEDRTRRQEDHGDVPGQPPYAAYHAELRPALCLPRRQKSVSGPL